MLTADRISANAALARPWVLFLLGWVLAFPRDAQASPQADPTREAKSGTATGRSVKGLKLKVSPNGRHFVDQHGKPFFYLGDTAWLLFQRLNNEEVDEYLKDRAGKGFTVVQSYVLRGLEAKHPDGAVSLLGAAPLVDRDPTRPNEAFFKNVDHVVNRANELGLVMGLVTAKSWHVNEHRERVFDAKSAYTFGKFLGQRYKNNAVLWYVGGDSPPGKDEAVWVAMAKGLKDGSGGSQLVCYHGQGSTSSSQWFHEADWLDFNSIQSGHHFGSDSYKFVSKDYALKPAKPTVDMEPAYENHPTGKDKPRIDAHKVRTQAYTAMLAGAAGHGYGAMDLFYLYNDKDGPFPRNGFQPWRKAIAYEGSTQVGLMRNLFEQRPWHEMVPDQSVLAAGQGEGIRRIPAARASDGSFVIAYLPQGQTVGIRMDKLAGKNVKAQWYDPRTGKWSHVGEYPNTGVREFAAPSRGEKDDWVLVLEDAGKKFPVKSGASTKSDSTAATVRIASCQAKRRSIDWRLTKPAEVLAAIDRTLDELEKLVHKAGEARCDVLALPEDTLGLLDWGGMNEAAGKEVLPKAVKRMIDRLGRAAAKHRMYLVVCSDFLEADGKTYNTAFFLGRDGKEIGRYHKVCPTWGEGGSRERGKSFPVFPTADLGTVGMLICYDLVMPETARCLALKGADVVFFPTMGGAALGDDDIGMQALRVRAAENHVWLVVAFRGNGAMIISPRGKIVAKAEGPDGLAIADIDPHGGRTGGDSANTQKDMRARLFRERTPEAFKILTEKTPPVLAKVPIDITPEEAGRIFARMLTVGDEEFKQAAALAREGKTKEAIAAFERLRTEYRGTWIDRVSRERLATLRGKQEKQPEASVKPAPKEGLACLYPGDAGIERDPRVVFVENFEHASPDVLAKRWETVSGRDTMSLSSERPANSTGKQSLLVDRTKGPAGQLYRRLKNDKGGWGYDRVFARYYVKFDPDCGEIHHFGTTIGGHHPATPWPMVRAGVRPDGAKTFWSGIEPFGSSWTWDYYTYWCEMRGSPPRGQTWGNVFIRDPKLKVEKGKWICIEQMIKLNDVGDSNGEQALWIDGKQVSHLGKGFPSGVWIFDKFNPGKGGAGVRWNDAKGDREPFEVPKDGVPFEGFRWRTAKELNVNYLWLYVYTQKPDGHRIKVWFDDVVVATEYIGPIAKQTEQRP